MMLSISIDRRLDANIECRRHAELHVTLASKELTTNCSSFLRSKR